MRGAIFDVATGQISRIVDVPASMMGLNCGAGESWVPAEGDTDGERHFVDTDTMAIVPRPPMPFDASPVSLEAEEVLRIEDIPAGTVLQYPDGMVVVDDGYIEWASDEPGAFVFRFQLFPYQEAIIHATVAAP